MDRETMEMALVGYRQQVAVLSAKISEIEKGLRAPAVKRGHPRVVGVPRAAGKRKVSAETRAKMSAAQKARRAMAKG